MTRARCPHSLTAMLRLVAIEGRLVEPEADASASEAWAMAVSSLSAMARALRSLLGFLFWSLLWLAFAAAIIFGG